MDHSKPPALVTNSPPPDAPDVAFWDEFFNPIWQRLVRSILRQYSGISTADAQDLAGATIAKVVEHFEFHTFAGRSLEERRAMLFAYIKAVRRGVAAEFFAVRNGETELIEVMVITDAAIFSNDTQSSGTGASKIRKALNRLDRWDRDLVRYKAVHGWTFPDIRAEFRRQGYPIELGALRMRYSRALAQLKRDLGQSFFY